MLVNILIIGTALSQKCYSTNRVTSTITATVSPTPVPEPTRVSEPIEVPKPIQPSKPVPKPRSQEPHPAPRPKPVQEPRSLPPRPIEREDSDEEQPVSKNRPRAFNYPQSGIGSWFRANHGSDYTNGNSWCGYPYKDYTPGFAPDLAQMSQGTNAVWPHPRWEEFGKEYCGLEAIVKNPETGVEMKLYIVDAFDPKWVRTPGSIDIMVDVYKQLTQDDVLNKNKVIKGVEWRLTGNRNPKYAFKGPGDR